jgi:hypothetical protein
MRNLISSELQRLAAAGPQHQSGQQHARFEECGRRPGNSGPGDKNSTELGGGGVGPAKSLGFPATGKGRLRLPLFIPSLLKALLVVGALQLAKPASRAGREVRCFCRAARAREADGLPSPG